MRVVSKIIACVQIARPVNICITFAAVIIAGYICGNSLHIPGVIWSAAAATALVNYAGNIINDIFDIKTDELNNKKNRVLQKKSLSVAEAYGIYVIVSVCAFIISATVNVYALTLVVFATLALFLYSWYLKKKLFWGNVLVALLTALAFIMGGIAVGNIQGTFVPAVFAFLINLVRELVKDMQDVEGDKKSGFNTMPVRYGINNVKIIVMFNIFIIIAFTLFVWQLKLYKMPFSLITLLLVDPVFVFILRYLFINNLNRNLNKISLLLKLNMVLGLCAIVAGV